MDKREISRIFEEIGLLLEMKGESPFKSRAYYNAARTIEMLTEDISELVASGRIREVRGIGEALAGKLAELVGTGRLGYYEELKRSVPRSEEHTSELQSQSNLVCRLLLEKKKKE